MSFTNKFSPLQIGQHLIFLSLIGVITSPPIANFFLALSLIWVLSFKDLRIRLWIFLNSTTGLLLASFIVILIIGLSYSSGTNSDKLHEVWGWRKILALPLAASLFINSPTAKNNFLKIYLFACLVLCVISCFLFLMANSGVILRNYVTQGLAFAIASLISLHFLFQKEISKKYKLLLSLSFILFFGNIVFISISRSGYMAFFVMITLYIILKSLLAWRTKVIYLTTFFVIAISIFYLTPTTNNRINLAIAELNSGMHTSEPTSIGFRLMFFKNTLPIIENNFFWGVGTGGFKNAYSEQVSGHPFPENLSTTDPHNQYLKILAEHGAIGLLTFLGLLVAIFNLQSNQNLKIIGALTLLSWCITSLFNSHFTTFNEGQFIWLWLGVFFAPEDFIDKKKFN